MYTVKVELSAVTEYFRHTILGKMIVGGKNASHDHDTQNKKIGVAEFAFSRTQRISDSYESFETNNQNEPKNNRYKKS
jgi:hypothetical protein